MPITISHVLIRIRLVIELPVSFFALGSNLSATRTWRWRPNQRPSTRAIRAWRALKIASFKILLYKYWNRLSLSSRGRPAITGHKWSYNLEIYMSRRSLMSSLFKLLVHTTPTLRKNITPTGWCKDLGMCCLPSRLCHEPWFLPTLTNSSRLNTASTSPTSEENRTHCISRQRQTIQKIHHHQTYSPSSQSPIPRSVATIIGPRYMFDVANT